MRWIMSARAMPSHSARSFSLFLLPSKEVMELADPDVIKGRVRRLKRASDLCYKQKILQDYAPDMKLEPFKEELYPDLVKLRKRNDEIALLNLHKK